MCACATFYGLAVSTFERWSALFYSVLPTGIGILALPRFRVVYYMVEIGGRWRDG